MGRREEKKAMKRHRLETEGLRLFLEQGYDRTSIEQVAAASDIARGTFYLYFTDKRALFDALVDRWFADLLEVISGVEDRIRTSETREAAWQVYRDMAASLAVVGMSHTDEILLSFREARTTGESGQLVRHREAAIWASAVGFTEIAMERGWVRPGNPRVLCLVIFGAVERLVYEVLVGTELGDPAQVASEVVALFESALGEWPS